MKKYYLFVFLFSQLSFAQLPQTVDIDDMTAFRSFEAWGYNKDSQDCSQNVTSYVNFFGKLDTSKDYTFNDSYYRVQFHLYGDGNLISINDPSSQNYYSEVNNYFFNHPLDDSWETYSIIVTIQEYILVGYPDFMNYKPLGTIYTSINHYQSKSNNRCPKAIVNIDSDGDGVLDSLDKCPGHNDNIDTDGDGIPDGCDSTNNNAKPNLTLSGFKVKVGSTTYDAFATTNNIPEFKYGENHTFTVKVGNNDGGNASSSNCKLLVSEGKNYPNIGSIPVYEYRTFNVGAISGNSNKEISFSEYFYDNISSLNLQNDKTYWLILHIDYNNNVSESNENNVDNIRFINFKYKKPATGKIALKIGSNTNTIDIDYVYSSSTNNLKLQSIHYDQLRYTKTIHEQNPTVNVTSLYNGIYAVYINNTYIKKIGLTTGREYTGGPLPYEP